MEVGTKQSPNKVLLKKTLPIFEINGIISKNFNSRKEEFLVIRVKVVPRGYLDCV